MLFENEIPAEVLVEVVNTVREIENEEEPEWYPYDASTLYGITINSGWKFKKVHVTAEDLLLASIFGRTIKNISSIDNFKNFLCERNISFGKQKTKRKH